jgi:hypothetical protein
MWPYEELPWAWHMCPFFGWPQIPHLYFERLVLFAFIVAGWVDEVSALAGGGFCAPRPSNPVGYQ